MTAGPRRRARPDREPMLDVAPGGGTEGRAALARPGRAAFRRAVTVTGSAALHAAALAALVFWPISDPVEEPGQVGSVALVFAETVAEAGGGGVPPAPPAPPAPPTPPAPAATPAAPRPPSPPPPPPTPSTAAPPAAPGAAALPPAVAPPPPVPEAPRDLAALPPDPAGAVPPPPSTEAPPPPDFIEPPPAEQAAPSLQPDPPAQQAAPSPPPEPRPPQQQATAPPTQAQADPLPLPPPPPPEPPQRAAAASPPSRPAQPAAPQGPVRLDAGAGDMAAPSLGSFALGAVVPPSSDAGVRNNPPDYPEDARRRGQEGVVRLALRVNAEGLVTNAAVEESSGVPSLDRAAMEAARRWRFRPAMRAGMPVAATLTTAVHFRLSDSRGR